MAWVINGSPLWHRDTVQVEIKSLPSIGKQIELEKGFVNDGIQTSKYHTTRKKPIIPPYDAVKDKYAQAYFHSPIVRAVMDRNRTLKEIKDKQEAGMRINKLSYRMRCKMTPTVEEMQEREQNFVNDAIITEKKRTKYKDIIPVYNATNDNHCLAYFARPDVQRLIKVTCSPRRSLDLNRRKSLHSGTLDKSRDLLSARKSVC